MKSTIGIYDSHELAVDAVKELKDSGFPVSQLSIMGLSETEVVDKEMHIMPDDPIKPAGLGAGLAVGTTVGILTGVGLFAIPGLGILYGAGALVGAIAGFDFGLIGGGIATALATFGVKDDTAKKYHDALAAGKFLVLANGTEEEVHRAQSLLHEHGTHGELLVH